MLYDAKMPIVSHFLGTVPASYSLQYRVCYNSTHIEFPQRPQQIGGEMDRPTGVYLISFLQVFLGAYLVSVAFFDFVYGSFFDGNTLLASLALVTGIINFVLGFGIWGLKGWAWMLTLVFQFVHIAREILSYFLAGQYLGFLSLIISAVIIYYLTRPEIRKLFGK